MIQHVHQERQEHAHYVDCRRKLLFSGYPDSEYGGVSQCARPQSGYRSEQSSISSVQSPTGHLVQDSLLLDLCRLVTFIALAWTRQQFTSEPCARFNNAQNARFPL